MGKPIVDAARLRVTLQGLSPAPWREIEVPLSMTLSGLHDTIQIAFLWFNAHLWEFHIDEKCYALPFEDDFFDPQDRIYNAKSNRLKKLLTGSVTEFIYIYDMGDDWTHQIEVLELFDAPAGSRLPVFLNGQWRTPPEDVGGVPGFEAFIEAMENPKHLEHQDVLHWYGDPFDRSDIEPEIINIQMKRLANMRRVKT